LDIIPWKVFVNNRCFSLPDNQLEVAGQCSSCIQSQHIYGRSQVLRPKPDKTGA